MDHNSEPERVVWMDTYSLPPRQYVFRLLGFLPYRSKFRYSLDEDGFYTHLHSSSEYDPNLGLEQTKYKGGKDKTHDSFTFTTADDATRLLVPTPEQLFFLGINDARPCAERTFLQPLQIRGEDLFALVDALILRQQLRGKNLIERVRGKELGAPGRVHALDFRVLEADPGRSVGGQAFFAKQVRFRTLDHFFLVKVRACSWEKIGRARERAYEFEGDETTPAFKILICFALDVLQLAIDFTYPGSLSLKGGVKQGPLLSFWLKRLLAA